MANLFDADGRYTGEGAYVAQAHEKHAKETILAIAQAENVNLRIAFLRAVKRTDGSPLWGHFGQYNREELEVVWIEALSDAYLSELL